MTKQKILKIIHEETIKSHQNFLESKNECEKCQNLGSYIATVKLFNQVARLIIEEKYENQES